MMILQANGFPGFSSVCVCLAHWSHNEYALMISDFSIFFFFFNHWALGDVVVLKLSPVNKCGFSSWTFYGKWISGECLRSPLKSNQLWFQVMTWYHQATSHYLSQCWPRSILPYDITRPLWIKRLYFNFDFSVFIHLLKLIIVLFHNHISNISEQHSQLTLVHKSQQPTTDCLAIFHKYCCYIKHGGIVRNLTLMKTLGVYNWYVKMPQCGYVVHGLKHIIFYVHNV